MTFSGPVSDALEHTVPVYHQPGSSCTEYNAGINNVVSSYHVSPVIIKLLNWDIHAGWDANHNVAQTKNDCSDLRSGLQSV